LYTILERVFETISFEAPELERRDLTIDGRYVRERLAEVVRDEDLSKFIL
jgi:ATP-dependent HslUV protease ATP-binding subunit HslU